MGESDSRKGTTDVRTLVRSLIPRAPSPILLPSLSAASTKRLIRSLLPRPAFILDFPCRRLDRERDFYAIILWPPSLAEVASASPEQTSSCSPSFLPSFPLRTNCRPSVRALPALPSLSRPLRLTFSHNLASSVARVRPSVTRSLASSLLPPSRMAAGFRSVALQPNFLEGKLDSDDSPSFAPFSAQVSPTCLPTFFSDSQMSSHRQSSLRKMVTPRLTRKVRTRC